MNIDLNKIKEALPERAKVEIIKYRGKSPAIEVRVSPPMDDNDFDMCLKWQKEILGDNLMEFFTEETGHHWYAFLKNNNRPVSIEI